MKNTYFKTILRDIKSSKGRFIAIILIIFLGTFLFVGIKAVGPSKEYTANKYMNQSHLSDMQVLSTAGLTSKDAEIAESVPGVEAQLGYKFSYVDQDSNNIAEIFSYDKNDIQNQLLLVEGKLPTQANEIVLDALAKKNGISLNDDYLIDNSNHLENIHYKVVGFANSPIFIDNKERGVTNVGNGSITYFAYVPIENFNSPAFSIMYVNFDNTKNLDRFKDKYKDIMEENTEDLEKVFVDRPAERMLELLGTIPDDSSTMNIDEISSNSTNPTYYFNGVETNPGFQSYSSLAERIDAIGNVFPVFFIFIAMLITFTTMTRMVEEKRKEIGTLKALGYSKIEISSKYITYALIAAFVGCFFGIIIGTNMLPRVVFEITRDQYIFTQTQIIYSWLAILLSLLFVLISTLGSTIIILIKELHEKPALLMVAKAPKAGKRILLEYITPLWSRLNFNQKVSYRNLFRFKSRMILAIIGIAGCTGLMIAGFGIKDSVDGAVTKQFGPITHYDGAVTLNEGLIAGNEISVNNIFDSNSKVKSYLPVFSEMVTFENKDANNQSASLFVPSSNEDFSSYVSLKDTSSNKEISLPKEGVVVTSKLAKLLNCEVGDTISIIDANNNTQKIKVVNVVENYLGHFIYMNKDYYENVFGKTYTPNTYLIQTKELNIDQEKALIKELNNTKKVANITFLSTEINQQLSLTENLGSIVLILVVLSGMLAFVVLYNLTNINISERVRELSTLKVLGFYNGEVTMYIVRENVIFTIFGILLGFLVGNLLTSFIIQTVELDILVFPLIIHNVAYIFSGVLTLLFSFIVLLFTHFKLKRVDMIESLKSSE